MPMKQSYLALLRGVNVGGNNIIKMADLKATLEAAGFQNVRTYIQSGNVLFSASEVTDTDNLAALVEETIASHFQVPVRVAVFSKPEWQAVIASAPDSWGKNPDWKHNLLVMLKPCDIQQAVAAIGDLKPDIEALQAGDGVLYQSVSIKSFGRATTGKLAASAVYKQMTVRSYNTAVKLSSLLNADPIGD